MKRKLLVYAVLAAVFLNGCLNPVYEFIVQDNYVKKVTFEGQTATIDLKNLNGNDIYLVKLNMSGNIVNASNTGGINSYTEISGSNERTNTLAVEPDRIQEFNANLPLDYIDRPQRSSISTPNPTSSSPSVGDTRMFWVEAALEKNDWVQKQATLRAAGSYGNIWVMDENFGQVAGKSIITEQQAAALAEKFDLIYSYTTGILGYEYGGGPGGNGGRDGDPKIQILVYDFNSDSAIGFFWSKDYYSQEDINRFGWSIKTNYAEIFYLDAEQVNRSIEYTYSVMIHELQHMINFNVKYVVQGRNSAVWYNEMLSLMAEDIIAPLIGISHTNNNHVIKGRMPRFNRNYYEVGVTEWNGESISYAKALAFGAYLMRNFGGPELLHRILANDTTNIESVSSALNEIKNDIDFDLAFGRYGEAMIYSGLGIPEDVMTFDKTVSSIINGNTYTAYGFDLWEIGNGPHIFDLNNRELRPHSMTIHSTARWKKIRGNYSITLERPANPNVVMYIMVK